MDVIPMCSIFQELQIVHDTGYFSALPSLEEYWQQVNARLLTAPPAAACRLRACGSRLECVRRRPRSWLTAAQMSKFFLAFFLSFFLFRCSSAAASVGRPFMFLNLLACLSGEVMQVPEMTDFLAVTAINNKN